MVSRGLNVRGHGNYCWNTVEQVKELLAVGVVEEESIGFQVGEIAGKWHTP